MYRENIESKVEKVAELYDGKARTLDEFLIHAKAVAKGTGEIGIVNSVRVRDIEEKTSENYLVYLRADEINYNDRKILAYGNFQKIVTKRVDKEVEQEIMVDIAIKYQDGRIVDIHGNELEDLQKFNFYFECEEALFLADLREKEYSQTPVVSWYEISGKLDEKKSKTFFNKNEEYFIRRGSQEFTDYNVVSTSLESDSGESILRLSNILSNGKYEIEISESVATRYSVNHGIQKEEFYRQQKEAV